MFSPTESFFDCNSLCFFWTTSFPPVLQKLVAFLMTSASVQRLLFSQTLALRCLHTQVSALTPAPTGECRLKVDDDSSEQKKELTKAATQGRLRS
nr:hypothetical protein Iba_chr06aCG8880 [Ipomoea batatas]